MEDVETPFPIFGIILDEHGGLSPSSWCSWGFLRRQVSCFDIGILGLCSYRLTKWPHLFVIKFVYWWLNVCILCICYIYS